MKHYWLIITLLVISGCATLEESQLYKSANGGDAASQLALGDAYHGGSLFAPASVERNVHQAVHWYKQAAMNGNAEAQFRLAKMTRAGEGVDADPVEAARWMQAAANGGHTEAQHQYGLMLLHGEGVKADINAAEEMLSRVPDAIEDADLQYEIGTALHKGVNGQQDYQRAAHWIARAAKQDHIEACFDLGEMYQRAQGLPEDHKKAASWYLMAAQEEHPEAMYRLGLLYSNGLGLIQNRDVALEWLLRAAQAGHMEAPYVMGEIYYNEGIDGAKPKEKLIQAYTWLTIAATGASVDDNAPIGHMMRQRALKARQHTKLLLKSAELQEAKDAAQKWWELHRTPVKGMTKMCRKRGTGYDGDCLAFSLRP